LINPASIITDNNVTDAVTAFRLEEAEDTTITGIRGLRITNNDGQPGVADALFMLWLRGDFNDNGKVDIGR